MTDFTNVEGITTKSGKHYVTNKDLLKEIIISKERGELTYNAVMML